jgi:inosine/xanthosine triphosphate pyrophosphatase family protein
MGRLTDGESSLVLRTLLERHQTLRKEAENLATEIVSAPSCEDIASEVADAVTSLDIQELNGRAGATRYGYTEPTEAAWQLLEESMEDFLADMERRAELGLTDAAITMCRGIVAGLYKARSTGSDGPLGWAPDFPAEEAGHAVAELLQAIPDQSRGTIRARLVDAFTTDAPDWADMLTRAASEEG